MTKYPASNQQLPREVPGRTAIATPVRRSVLTEAGFKCANPTCRAMLTLNVHHMFYVSHGGPNDADNLIALCGHCHDMHHAGHIPGESIRAWKMILLSLNEGYDKRSIDILLMLDCGPAMYVSGDGVLQLAPLIASRLVAADPHIGVVMGGGIQATYRLELLDKGHRFLEAWRAGDQRAALAAMRAEVAAEAEPVAGSTEGE